MVAVWAGQGIALALGSCPGQAGARGSAAGRRPVPQGREALLRRGGPGRILQAAACPHAGDVRSVLMHIDRVPRRPCAVKTRKHPRSKLTNEINCGWWLPGTPPIPESGMFVQMMEYRHPVYFS